jgi:hypothetical protein
MNTKPKERRNEMKVKIKWKASEKETGRYKSFHKRAWPTAEFSNGDTAFEILLRTVLPERC